MTRWKHTLVAAAVCGLALSGCGSKENDDKPAASDKPTPTMSAAQQAACDALVAEPADSFAAVARVGDPSKLTAADWQHTGEQFTTIAAGTTGAAQQAAQTVADTIDEALSTKNMKLLDSDEFGAAQGLAATAGRADCGFKAVDFKVHEHPMAGMNPEFKYEGLPETLEAGTYSLGLTNKNKNFHEVIAVRLKDSFTGSAEDFAKLPDPQLFAAVEGGGFAFAPPGQTGMLNTKLEPGRYIMFCHIPLDDGKGNPKMGPHGPIWHFTIGMKQLVTVS